MVNKIIVTGANGQLGNCLRDIAQNYPDYEFIFTDVAELDITCEECVKQFFATHNPAWVINAAAYTAVDKAESDRATAELLNAKAVGVLARASAACGAALLHVSTDYVFDGKSEVPLTESAATAPISVYGATKLEGERQAALNVRHLIFRTSWLYSIYGNNFVKTMRRLGSEREEIGVVADQWGSPTSADDLAAAIMTAIPKADSGAPVWGLYHYSNEGCTSWADFAREIMQLSNLKCRVNNLTTDQYPTPAQRPHFSLLSKEKFTHTFAAGIPDWKQSLAVLISKLDNLVVSK